MQRLLAISILAVALPLASIAQAEDGRVYYKDGLRFEAGDFDMKANVQLQPRYEYIDNDSDAEDADPDTSGVRIRRARLVLSGNLLDKAFSYKLQNDFASDGGGGDLKDAWLQWNGDFTNLRFGQFKVPFVRQFLVSSSNLFFADRGSVSEFFDYDRNLGAMAHNEIGEGGHYYLAIFNGNSDGEGSNSRAVDTKHAGVFAFDFSGPDYGKRNSEGALGDESGFTVGGSVLVGQGENEGGDFDELGLNGDVGFRTAGLDLQGEVAYSSIDPDEGEDLDQIGYYVQATYVCAGDWGLGGRFGYIDPDEEGGVDDIQEYTVGVDYFIDGHRLKLQNQATFEVTSFEGNDEDLEDFRYILQLSGYF